MVKTSPIQQDYHLSRSPDRIMARMTRGTITPWLLATDGEGLTVIACSDYRCPLDLHQPGVATPGRLLGTCEGCRAWFLIEAEPGGAGTVPARLPEGAALRRAPEA